MASGRSENSLLLFSFQTFAFDLTSRLDVYAMFFEVSTTAVIDANDCGNQKFLVSYGSRLTEARSCMIDALMSL